MGATSGLSFTPQQFAQRAPLTHFIQNVDIDASKRRCVERYKLDEAANQKTIFLTAQEIAEHREPFEDLLELIAEELDYVAAPLSSVNFGASFSNMAGTILYYRSDHSAGNYVDAESEGALWAEGVAGTNGVGTCIVERRPAQVFGSQHFFRAHAKMSCTAVPVLSADAEMFGVLNFCSANPEIRLETFQLVSGLVHQTAERLNNHLFRVKFGGNAVLRARTDHGPILLALDADNSVVGANMLARHWLGFAEGPLRPVNLAKMFEHDGKIDDIVSKSDGAVVLCLQGRALTFKVTPPKVAHQTRGLGVRTNMPATRDRIDRIKQGSTAAPPGVEDCLGTDPAMLNQVSVLRRLSHSRLPILLLGETGTGKDTLARALHLEGPRAGRPFVAFNCAAVPDTLIDSELFGYNAGAFTGARREGNEGRLLQADGGTLFLDEIGDMPVALQTRLLRVLESGEVSPLGSGRTKTVNIQVIAATNQELKSRIQEGSFRSDLYHRLSGVVVNMIPLRNRHDRHDIILKMLHRLCGDQIQLSEAALIQLQSYHWPGNMRELSHVLQRAIQLCEGKVINTDDLLLDRDGIFDTSSGLHATTSARLETAGDIRFASERSAFMNCLRQYDGDLMKTAKALQISRATIYRKLRKFQ